MSERTSIAEFLQTHADPLAMRIAEHLSLTGITIALAFALGVLLAVLSYRRAAWRSGLLGVCSMLQTVPGIALLVIMLAVCGRIGLLPALCALVLYALLPIVQNTLVGLQALDPALAEAARGIGLNRRQRLWYVRLPLALPLVLAGLRTASVQTVGLATLAAFIGAGGLGQFINRGLFLSDTRLILLGAIPSALIALALHSLLGLATRAASPGSTRRQRRWSWGMIGAMLVAAILFTLVYLPAAKSSEGAITIGSKNFTEQLIIAEMVAQQIERTTTLKVNRRFGLGGSRVVHEALTNEQIDLAVEYTGTALTSILHQPVPKDAALVFPQVRDAYAQRFAITWFSPLGFNNSYVLALRHSDAHTLSSPTISALSRVAGQKIAAFDFEFAERKDGYAGLKKTYGLRFARVVDMHPDLLYTALRRGEVDVISAYATDGRLDSEDLQILVDDRHFFPPYDAAIHVRNTTLAAHPALRKALASLSGTIDDARMRRANAAVDQGRLSVEQAATELLGI